MKPTVRFGRVPKREKAKILAAMQSVNAKSQEKALSLELEDETKLVSTIVKAHADTCDYTKDKISPLLQRARDDPVYTQCTPQLACPLNPSALTHQNGNQRVMEDFSERFSPAIRGVVEFAKRIPGFGLLSQDDQVTLLKAGVFEVLLVRLACMFDSRTNTMVCLNGQVLKRESLQHTSNARFLMDSMFDFADRLNMLQLVDSELGLFCAVVVIAADRPGLRNVELVEKMQGKLMQALQNTTVHGHPQSQNLYQELMRKIPDLRTLNTLHSEKLLAFKMEPHAAVAQAASTISTVASTNMHALYQTHVGHWNAYGIVGHKSPHLPGTSSEDSKGSWEDADNLVPSPAQHGMLSHDHHHRLVHGGSDGSAWSPGNDSTKNQDLYSSSTRSSEDVNYRMDEGLVKSPMGSTISNKSGSLHIPSKDNGHLHEGGNSSGDETTLLAVSPNSKCPFKGRKLDSPNDSGIDSGKELGNCGGSSGSQSRSTSICSSPRSSMEEKVKDISDCELSVKQESIEDMPVLKRALQAPPLINTNLLMDEAYKPHKKFRALRKDSDSGSEIASSPSSMSSGGNNCQSPMSVVSVSLASTHSTLVKTLSQCPRLSEQQLKRTDIIHNIIMRSEQTSRSSNSTFQNLVPQSAMAAQQQQQPPSSQDGASVVYPVSLPSSPNPPSPSPPYGSTSSPSGKSSLMVCSPGYYIPQPGATNHGNGYPTSVVSAANPQWTSSYITRTTSPSRHSYVATSPSSNGQQMSLNVVSSTLHHQQQQQQQQQQHFSSNLIQQSQSAPVPSGNSTSPLPRMYYHPQGGTSSSPILATTPQSPTSMATAAIKQVGISSSTHVINNIPSSVKSPTSPLAGQVMIDQQQQHYQPPQTDLSDRSSMDSQPLNLSKKLCSPPPRSHTHHLSSSPIVQTVPQDRSVSPCPSQRVKMEVI